VYKKDDQTPRPSASYPSATGNVHCDSTGTLLQDILVRTSFRGPSPSRGRGLPKREPSSLSTSTPVTPSTIGDQRKPSAQVPHAAAGHTGTDVLRRSQSVKGAWLTETRTLTLIHIHTGHPFDDRRSAEAKRSATGKRRQRSAGEKVTPFENQGEAARYDLPYELSQDVSSNSRLCTHHLLHLPPQLHH
jgi:hypothetical protein